MLTVRATMLDVTQAALPATGGAAVQGSPHAVIIGSGFGGLAAAVRLGARGYRVTVLERLDAPGGRAYVHRQDGFTFDAGPTIITVPYLLEDLWQLAGRRLADDIDLRPMDAVLPAALRRRQPARHSRAIRRACAPRWRGCRRAMSRATSASWR